jgi:hypothetical protein
VKSQFKGISNPGSALGEAIGVLVESAIHKLIKPIAEENGCIYISTGLFNPKTGKSKKLILRDENGIEYNIDSVIINNRFQPLVLLESKYIRYTKHNRDKASWICTAHTKLRQRYITIRKSIVILMGNWSIPSKRLLKSFEVELFEVPFLDIKNLLADYNIIFDWEEKDRKQAATSLLNYRKLTNEQKMTVASELLLSIKDELSQSLKMALDENIPRKIISVSLIIYSNHGERFTYHFNNLQEAVEFMTLFDEERDIDTTNADNLLDIVKID